MVLATVPEAPPTRRNQRATSCPAPISAKEPKIVGSRLRGRALRCVSMCTACGMTATPTDQARDEHRDVELARAPWPDGSRHRIVAEVGHARSGKVAERPQQVLAP